MMICYTSRSKQRDELCSELWSNVQSLKSNINEDTILHIEVRRDHVLEDTIKEAQKNRFDPSKLIKVVNYLLNESICLCHS